MGKYRALLVGAGGFGRWWGEVLHEHPDVELAGWVDTQPEAARECAAKLGLSKTYIGADLDKALRKVRPDFVVDVSPHYFHHDTVTRALRFGVPVIGEKPMADSMDEARDMVAVSEQTGKLYMVSQSRRYDARIDAFRRLIRQRLGTLGILNADFYKYVTFGGYRLKIRDVLLLDMAIHTFDSARYICGCDAVAVFCEQFNPPWSDSFGLLSANANFEMENGLRFSYRGSWAAQGKETTWESEWRAVGANGTATWDGDDGVTAEVVDRSGEEPTTRRHRARPERGMPTGIRGSLRDFLHALETGATPQGECHDNIKSLAMVFAAVESAETGRRVEIRI